MVLQSTKVPTYVVSPLLPNLKEVGGVVEPIVPVAGEAVVTPALVCFAVPERVVPLAWMMNVNPWSPLPMLLWLLPVHVPWIQLVLEVGVAVGVVVAVGVAVAVGDDVGSSVGELVGVDVGLLLHSHAIVS